jgi:hypothetical protein
MKMQYQLRLAGSTLIATSLGFVVVFDYLARHFGYPEVLEGAADRVLPALVAAGATMRGVWALYALLPSGVALAAILAFPLFRRAGDSAARLGLVAAIVATLAMTAGLMRWPTINHVLGRAFVAASADQRRVLAAVFDAGNLYLGTVTGEFIGELALSLWFLTLGLAIVRGVGIPRWVGYAGTFTAVGIGAGAFRNVSSLVVPIAAVNNVLLPLWMIVLGIALVRGDAASQRMKVIRPFRVCASASGSSGARLRRWRRRG